MMYSAYFDRIANHDQAVLLVESLQKDLLLPTSSLPVGSKPGSWFLIELRDEEITTIELDEEKTNKMENDIQNRLKRLQSRKKSRFKKRQ